MTTLKTDPVEVNANSKIVFDYLTDLSNFIELIPQDKVSDWKGEKDTCSFKFLNTAVIQLVLKDHTSPSSIQLVSGEKSPVKFTLDISIEESKEGCMVGQTCEANLNPMLKMMVQQPLKNLFSHISHQLQEKFKKNELV